MKVLKSCVCVAALMVCGSLAWHAVAEDAPTKPVTRKESRGQLPAQFGKIGLSDEVKDQLYIIDRDYDEKIQKLADEIKRLQAERDTKMQEKLTDSQRTQLKALRAEAAEKRAARAAKIKNAAQVESPPAAEPKPAGKSPN